MFDNPAYADRYTVVLYQDDEPYGFISMNASPLCLTKGLCNNGQVDDAWVEQNKQYETSFDKLPEDCQKVIHLEFIDWSDSIQ